ncbi:MAG: bifunctional phosphoribosylaminoimidazolecarboxamide formyltransferase/IMP cyclohydrolase [Candidatus Izimaplasma sp.]|nr:bifunctional phosphoribosylaminoimidazolecarboxamide formyltransferase/IMP cyclohydrolase [Candidatus Izimaplasma bacterium]
MKRALISVSNKNKIVPFAKALNRLDFEIISTGGTYKKLKQNNIRVTKVEDITNHKEILDGRVKTLHPKIHGGLLALRNNASHMKELADQAITPIDLVCVNLYPFAETIKQKETSFSAAIEQIDIGGPSMLRSAAKNIESVTVVTDTNDYDQVIEELETHGDTLKETKRKLSAKVFRHTAYYDSLIADYLSETPYPEKLTNHYTFETQLRYGENPHQTAALYKQTTNPYALFNAKQSNGKALSYNNIQDANAALNILKQYTTSPTAVALKHMNPCGVASNETLLSAFLDAKASDPMSIFGGIVALNNEVTNDLALELNKIFLEIVIAPAFTKKALTTLKKKKNLRVLQLDTTQPNTDTQKITQINGGILVQDVDDYLVNKTALKCVTTLTPTDKELEDLLFSWKVVKHVKSNAIVVSKNTKTVGIGAGQMNRVGAAKIALEWAKDHRHTKDLTLSSDAFFPFDDVVKLAHQYGVTKIIQPGGSIRDEDSIRACNELGIKMVFTNNRHFKH